MLDGTESEKKKIVPKNKKRRIECTEDEINVFLSVFEGLMTFWKFFLPHREKKKLEKILSS